MKLDSSKTDVYYLLLDLDDQQKREALDKLQKHQPELYQQVAPLVAAESSDHIDQLFQFTFEHSASSQVDYTDQQIDKYHILHELGRGGMGVVYAACRADKAFEQKLAIKLLQSDLAQVFDNRALFGEAQLLAKLNHPNIAKVFDGGIHNGEVYIVMEHVEGTSLDTFLSQHALSLTQKLNLFGQVCSALEYSHHQGIVHGDIKPENILVDEYQHIKLIDFNLTQKANVSLGYSECLTAFSKAFASPEQQQGKPVTASSDIYALGKLLMWLCPHQARFSDLGMIQQRATEHHSSKRFGSVTTLKQDIEALLEKRPISLKRHVPFYRSLRLFQRNPVISSLCLLLIGLGGYFSSSLAYKNQQLEHEKRIAENMIFEVSSMMFHSKSQAAQQMPLLSFLDLTRRRILANPDMPKHIKQKLLLVMMTPIEEKAASPTSTDKDKVE